MTNDEIANKINILKNMPQQDFQRLVYITNAIAKKEFEAGEEQLAQEEYMRRAQSSAICSFTSNSDLEMTINNQMGKNTPEEIRKSYYKQFVFNRIYNEIFQKYTEAGDKEEFFRQIDENLEESISKKAIEEMISKEAKEFLKEIEDKKANIQYDDKIKQSVIDFWLGTIKERYPDITKKEQEKFSKVLLGYINKQYDNMFGVTFKVDSNPCQELASAYWALGEKYQNIMFYPFPTKTSTHIEKSRYSELRKEYGDSKYLYISPIYLEERKKQLQQEIKDEEEKIPEEALIEFEEDYKKHIEEIKRQKEEVITRDEQFAMLEEQNSQLKKQFEQLLFSYKMQISQIASSDLSNAEKDSKRQELVDQINQAMEEYQSYNYEGKLEKARLKYRLAKGKASQYDEKIESKEYKEKFLQERKQIFMARELKSEELGKLYEEKRKIDEYEKEKEKGENVKTSNQEEAKSEFIDALAKAYTQDLYTYSLSYLDKQEEEEITNKVRQYLGENSDKIYEPEFLGVFKEVVIPQIIQECGESSLSSSSLRLNEDEILVEKDIVLKTSGHHTEIFYADQESAKQKLEQIESGLEFFEDNNIRSKISLQYKSMKRGLEEYLKNLQPEEPTLLELDAKKRKLEELEEKARQLLDDYKKQEKDGKEQGE